VGAVVLGAIGLFDKAVDAVDHRHQDQKREKDALRNEGLDAYYARSSPDSIHNAVSDEQGRADSPSAQELTGNNSLPDELIGKTIEKPKSNKAQL
jgi:hypothetical protein